MRSAPVQSGGPHRIKARCQAILRVLWRKPGLAITLASASRRGTCALVCIEGQVESRLLRSGHPRAAVRVDVSAAGVVGSERNKPVLIELVVEGL